MLQVGKLEGVEGRRSFFFFLPGQKASPKIEAESCPIPILCVTASRGREDAGGKEKRERKKEKEKKA